MGNIIKSFDTAFKRMKEKNWDCIYVLVDIHGTIFKPSYYDIEKYEYYPCAKAVLQLLTVNPKIKLILWTSSYTNEINQYLRVMEKSYIRFDYINRNDEVKDTDIQYFGDKLYFNVGLDDKFGFDPENDWMEILSYFSKNNYFDYLT